MMVREPPPLRIRPRLEVGDRAAQQPVVVGSERRQNMLIFGALDASETRVRWRHT